MIEVEEGILLFEKEVVPKKSTMVVPLEEAAGHVLAEKITASFAVPHFPKSAMDGYAVHHKDVEAAAGEYPVTLKVQGELCAGDYYEYKYTPGSAIRVMTGAYVPEGYTAVVKQEDTDYGEESVQVYRGIKEYQNYCRIGEDISEGTTVLEKGEYLKPVHIGLLASLGVSTVKVIEPVRVAIISTGSELLEVGSGLMPGKIYNSISYMLSALVKRAGFTVVSAQICQDEEFALKEALAEAMEVADVVITTGGVSVGKRDLIPEVLKEVGAKVLFHGANIQPGTPTMGSMLNGIPILSLSGNPYAAIANFEMYFWNIVCRLMDSAAWMPKTEKVVLASEYSKVNKLRRLIRASAKDGQVRIPTNEHASSVISTLARCNCFIDLEAGRELRIGDLVTIRYFDSI